MSIEAGPVDLGVSTISALDFSPAVVFPICPQRQVYQKQAPSLQGESSTGSQQKEGHGLSPPAF